MTECKLLGSFGRHRDVSAMIRFTGSTDNECICLLLGPSYERHGWVVTSVFDPLHTDIGYVARTQHYCTAAQASFGRETGAIREIFRHDTSLDSHDNWLLEPIGPSRRARWYAQMSIDCCRSARL